MNNNTRKFTKIYNDYFDYGLTSDEIIIVSIIDSYTENNKPCYITDEQFARYINKSRRSVQYIIAKLEQMHIITRTTELTSSNGQKSRIRTLTVNDCSTWQTEGSAKFAIPYAEGSAKYDNKVAQNTTEGSATSCDILDNKLDYELEYCANAQADAKDASSAQAQNEKPKQRKTEAELQKEHEAYMRKVAAAQKRNNKRVNPNMLQ